MNDAKIIGFALMVPLLFAGAFCWIEWRKWK
jgi:hypothetical protein